ncbi:MAG: hypothetical protein IPP48_02460 [Chitinophagaceae bacterium]|nr:hypothetical protein [Chitinophagaceae bacterium]
MEGRSHNLVRYSNLPAGQYSLLIKDKISDKISTVFIKIKKPYWATTWFILLVVAGITFLTWFIFRNYYLRKLEKHKAELEKQKAVEHERTRIAADMHDDLGSGLTKITYLSQMAINKDNSKEDLQAIKKTSTELVENMSEIIWAMKEENNSLEDLVYYIKVYAMEYCTGNNLNCVIHLPEKLYPRIIAGQSRRNIYLAVKETLHNIVKHAHAQNVTINVGFDKEWKISIKDDGVGINLNAQKIESHHGGNGLNNIKKRIEAVRGRVDIINNNGTEVIFYIPL